jgi:putative transposase
MARVVAVGIPHHITQRGNNRQTVFFSDEDRGLYLRLLGESSRRHGLRLLSYCLMSNHVHLVVVPERPDSLWRGCGRMHNDYSRWVQIRRQMQGHLWQNRYYSCPLDDGHLVEAVRYVELNPVRAGLVERAWDWRWSSAEAHAGGEDRSGLLDVESWNSRYTAGRWRAVLREGVAEEALDERIRAATRVGRPLGSDQFIERLEGELGRSLRPGPRGPKPKVAAASGV